MMGACRSAVDRCLTKRIRQHDSSRSCFRQRKSWHGMTVCGCKVQGTVAMFVYCCGRSAGLKKLLTHFLVSVPRCEVESSSPCTEFVEARPLRTP